MPKVEHKLEKVNLQEFEIGRTIGKGGCGRVHIAKSLNNNKHYAIKVIRKSEAIKNEQVDHVYNEIYVMSSLCHPLMATFKGFTQDSKNLYLVMELIQGGDLYSYLTVAGEFSSQQTKFYIANVVECLEYLHTKGIVYRDLKPENTLISETGYLKLVDFGFAKVLPLGRTFTLCGTPEYMAPEVILSKGHGRAVDWWSLGVFAFELHAGIDPFGDEDPLVIYRNILQNKIIFPNSFDKELKSLIKHLLVVDLTKRYGNLKEGANDIKNHRWFNNLSWDDIQKRKYNPEYLPIVNGSNDTSNLEDYPDSKTVSVSIKPSIDPFIAW